MCACTYDPKTKLIPEPKPDRPLSFARQRCACGPAGRRRGCVSAVNPGAAATSFQTLSRYPSKGAFAMVRPKVLLFVLLAGLLALPGALAAQTTADVVGRVTDTSGAVLPGASVTIENVGTKDVRTTVTQRHRGLPLHVVADRQLHGPDRTAGLPVPEREGHARPAATASAWMASSRWAA